MVSRKEWTAASAVFSEQDLSSGHTISHRPSSLLTQGGLNSSPAKTRDLTNGSDRTPRKYRAAQLFRLKDCGNSRVLLNVAFNSGHHDRRRDSSKFSRFLSRKAARDCALVVAHAGRAQSAIHER